MFALQLTVQVNAFCEDHKGIEKFWHVGVVFLVSWLLFILLGGGGGYMCIAGASRKITRAYSSIRLAEQNIQKEIVPCKVDLNGEEVTPVKNVIKAVPKKIVTICPQKISDLNLKVTSFIFGLNTRDQTYSAKR